MRSILITLSLLTATLAFPFPSLDSIIEREPSMVLSDVGEYVYVDRRSPEERAADRAILDRDVEQLQKRDACSSSSLEGVNARPPVSCGRYCEAGHWQVNGSVVRISDDIDCTTGTCAITKLDSVSIGTSWSVGLNAASPGGEQGNAIISGNVGFTWTKTLTTSTSYQFNPVEGDSGYMGFKPYLMKSCGDFQQWTVNYSAGPMISSTMECSGPLKAENKDACFYSPIKYTDGSALGDYIFCRAGTSDCS